MLPDHLRAVCFDIGGVLVRMPRGPLAEELTDILHADPEQIRRLLVAHGKRRRNSPRTLARIVATQCGSTEVDALEAALRLRHRDIATPGFYPDAIPTLEALAAAGWRICFLSNAVGDTEDRPRPDYYSFAEVVVHSWDIGYCKPEAGAFRAVEVRMGLAPHEMVNVGDSLRFDVRGATDAGWSAVHLTRLDTPSGAAPSISSLLDLPALLPPAPRANQLGAFDGAS